MKRLPRLARYIWWHRLKGHRGIKGYTILCPATVIECIECELVWERSLI